jgi:hypothetical protein
MQPQSFDSLRPKSGNPIVAHGGRQQAGRRHLHQVLDLQPIGNDGDGDGSAMIY